MVEESAFDVIIADLKMSSMGGMEILRRVRTLIRIRWYRGYRLWTVSSAVEVIKLGAFDYLPDSFTPDELRAVVRNALDAREVQIQNRMIRKEKSL